MGIGSNMARSAWRARCLALMLVLFAPWAHALPGALDTTFGQNGFAFAGFAGNGLNFARAASVAVQSDGKVVLVGDARTNELDFTNTAMALTRFNTDGTPDSSFGNGGKVLLAI